MQTTTTTQYILYYFILGDCAIKSDACPPTFSQRVLPVYYGGMSCAWKGKRMGNVLPFTHSTYAHRWNVGHFVFTLIP